MRVGSQPLPVTARIERAAPRPSSRAARATGTAAPPADRVELSAAAAQAAAAQALGSALGRSPEQVRELVSRANRDAAKSAQAVDLELLRRALG